VKANHPILIAACLALAVACKPHEADKPAEHKEPEKPSPVSHNDKGETLLKLDAEAVKRVGVKVEPLAAADFSPEAKGFGRVLDPAPLAALVSEVATAHLTVENSRRELELTRKRREGELALARASLKLSEASVQLTKAQSEAELAAAQAALKASSLELERAKTLAKQNNTSERALQASEATATKDKLAVASAKLGGTRAAQTAELAVQKDRLQLDLTDATTTRAAQAAEAAVHRDEVAAGAVRAKLATAYGRMLLDQENLVEFAQSLVVGQTALVRLDVPAGEPLKEQPTGAHLLSPAGAGAVITAQLLGPAGGTDAQLQGQGFLLLVKPEGTRLAPGMLVTGFLKLPGEVEHGVTVPRSAIVRHEGEAFIYLATKDGEFTKKEIELEHATPGGWFVHEGLKAGEKVVVSGAQQLLSEESKGKD
jgi:multidrug efflux pump subunit AcrA (membrane-fusion protein)